MKGKRILTGVSSIIALMALTMGLTLAQGPKPQEEMNPQAALGTAFTYQGRLVKGDTPVSDTCDFRFTLWDAESGGSQVGGTLEESGVSVTDGYFTVQLDFGSGAFTGDARWLQIEVKCTGEADYTDLGLQPITPAPYALALPGLWTQPNDTSPNLIGGYSGNSVTAGVVGATIGGGGFSSGPNRVTANYATVSGGFGNTAGQWYATVGGGQSNTADGSSATVGGGYNNSAGGWNATVGGGNSNTASGNKATVGGGYNNTASDYTATVGGGQSNEAGGWSATVGGGALNTAGGSAATVAGGYQNEAGGAGATVGGGGYDGTNIAGNRALAPASTIGGGHGNVITTTASYATVGGGYQNAAGQLYATVGGGKDNTASGSRSTISGGAGNTADGRYATVGGGALNVITATYGTIAGGYNITVTGKYASVGGGYQNVAEGYAATVPGGSGARASLYGQMAYAGGAFSGAGDAQASLYVLRGTTEGGSWSDLYLDGSSARLSITQGRTMTFDILIVGRNSIGESAGYHIQGVIENDGGATAFIGTPTVDTLGEDNTNWDVQVVADDTYDVLSVQAYGGTYGSPVRWVAVVRTAEVSY